MPTPVSRRFFLGSSLATGALATTRSSRVIAAANGNSDVNVGFISCGGRAGGLMSQFEKVSGVKIAGLCDPDSQRLGKAATRFPKARQCQDLRELIADPNLDAVVIATCNHWHCLAAIWAMEAGKHVYVEKPLSHSQWEGLQTVAAAEKYQRVCQLGTQQRSDPMQAEIKAFLHEAKTLGEIESVRVNRYGIRGSIGRRATPLPIDKSAIAYDQWLGPAQDQPIFRDKLHYDWHWDWNTGSGEMGNWGVHVLDDVRNNVFQDKVALPQRVMAGGGRVVWDDAGQSPNVHFAFFDTGSAPVVIGLSNLPAEPGSRKSPQHPGPGSGYVAYCQGGRLEGQRGRAAAYDADGKKVKDFGGSSGDVRHQENFIQAVRDEDPTQLNANVKVGHDSTGWCNIANVAYRAGERFQMESAREITDDRWTQLVDAMGEHLKAHGLALDNESIRLSPVLEMDPDEEVFVGEHKDLANPYLKRTYRKGYEVPELRPVNV